MDELEQAHKDYELRRNEIVTKLITIQKAFNTNYTYYHWINQAVEFIREREI